MWHFGGLLLQAELALNLKDYVGRESPLYHAERLSERYRKCVSRPAACQLLTLVLMGPGMSVGEGIEEG
jgi:hypothetical protein